MAVNQSTPIADQIKAKGYGKPGKFTSGVYDLTTVKSISSSAFKGIAFFGYDGTFNPKSVIKLERSVLVSSRVVKAGPHGGDMICGYNTSGGSGRQRVRVGHQDHLRRGGVPQGPGAGEIPGCLQARPRGQELGGGPGLIRAASSANE